MDAAVARELGAFVWTFPGGAQTAIADIEHTELGHFEEQGVTTTLYANGHVGQVTARVPRRSP